VPAGFDDMQIITRLFKSSLGKKYIMAVSGFVLFGFVVGHLAGNLQIFLGAEVINRYGHLLQSNPELIWPARLMLLAMIGLHIWSATRLSVENRAARPTDYGEYNPVGSTYASRTMLMTGLIVFCFIVYHLLHYTVRVPAINFTGQDFAGAAFQEVTPAGVHQQDVFGMMVAGFGNIWVSAFYVLGVGLLCLHLSHGISSMFQSIGWNNQAYRPLLDKLACLLGALIFLGYISIPVAILLGYGKEALK
jgi:succinate dehydrogenase / fumarate reductase cytochrome b subunit